MPDYYLGKARGEVVVDYDDRGLVKAEKGFQKLGQEAQKTGRNLNELGRETETLEQKQRRIAEQTRAMAELQERARVTTAARVAAEKELNKVLKDGTTTVDQSRKASMQLSNARMQQIAANNALRKAERALAAEVTATNAALAAATGGRAGGAIQVDANTAKAMAKIAALKAQANSRATMRVDANISAAMSKVAILNRAIASGGKGMGALSLGGAGGLLGAGGLGMLLPQIIGAVQAIGTLSGAMGTLPGVIGGAVFAMKTLNVATYGFGDALKAIGTGDLKKFAEQLQKMSPVAQKAALEFYKFSAQIKDLRNSVGDAFFGPFVNQIAALGQNYLPMVQNAMNGMAEGMGRMVSEFMTFLNTAEGMSLMQATFDNMKAGIDALAPAVQPFTKAWLQIMDVSSSFLPQLSADVVKLAQEFGAFIDKARESGELAGWIQAGIDAVKSLLNTLGQFGSAFKNIFAIAETSGGGFLNTLNMLATKFNEWTESVSGKEALGSFFTSLAKAAEALSPILSIIGTTLVGTVVPALANLGTAIAPGIEVFFTQLSSALKTLQPALEASAPALNLFLMALGDALKGVITSLAPVLPKIMESLAQTFAALLPILPELAKAFGDMLVAIAPLLPQLARLITPVIVGMLQDFAKIMREMAPHIAKVAEWIGKLADRVADGKKRFEELTGNSSALGEFWDTLKGHVQNVIDVLKFLWDWNSKVAEKLVEFGTKIAEVWFTIKAKAQEAWQGLVTVVTDFIPNLVKAGLNAGKQLIDSVIQGIKDNLGFFGNALGWLKDKVGNLFGGDEGGGGEPAQQNAGGGGPQTRTAAASFGSGPSAGAVAGGPSARSGPAAMAAAATGGGEGSGPSAGGPANVSAAATRAFGSGAGGRGTTGISGASGNSSSEFASIEEFIKNMMQITDLFSSLLNFSQSISDIVFQTLDYVKELSPQADMFQPGKWSRTVNDEDLALQREDSAYKQQLEDAKKAQDQQNSPGFLNRLPDNAPPELNAALTGTTANAGANASLDAFAKSLQGATYSMGGFSQETIDCSGAVAGLANVATGRDAFSERTSTMTIDSFLAERGFKRGKGGEGDLRVGWYDNGGGAYGHTAATLPSGMNFESSGPTGSAFKYGANALGANASMFTDHMYLPGSMIVAGSGIPTPGLIPEAQTMVDDVAKQQLSVQEQQLEVLKAQNPLLQQALDVAKNPADYSESQVIDSLNTISAESANQRQLNTAEGRFRADALDSATSKAASDKGLTQGASPVDQAANIAGGAFTVASDIIGLIQATLESISAAKEISGKLVAGVQNTEDIFKMVDNVQVFIDTAAKAAQAVGNAAGVAAGMSGGADMGISSGIAAVAGMIAGGLQATNAAIDIGQEIYRIVGKYAGGVLSTLAGAGQGALLGDVKFMLDKNTGQLVSQTAANPQDQRRLNVPDWLNWAYDYRGDAWQAGVQAQLNVYAGPGQSVHDTMNETMWLVNAGGVQAGPMNSAGNF